MHHILAAASRAEAVSAFWEGSASLLAGFAAVLFFGVVMAHIFKD